NAQVILPPTPVAEKAAFLQAIERIDQYDVDQGGTSMDMGISLGLGEVARQVAPGRVCQLVVLTDGETSGEQACRQLAKQAAEQKVRFTVMGVGTEWNSFLIKDLARLGEGKWYYIDVNNAQDAERAFLEEFGSLAQVGFTAVEMHLRPMKDIKVKRV